MVDSDFHMIKLSDRTLACLFALLYIYTYFLRSRQGSLEIIPTNNYVSRSLLRHELLETCIYRIVF